MQIFFEIWLLNTGFWMRYKSLINIKSSLEMYMIAVQGVGGGRNRLCILYWTPRGRVWEGYPLPRWRLFGNLGTKNQVWGELLILN